MSSRRRNGRLASCEPCRKAKVRCDHVLPVCSRCQQRGTTDHCFYHPGPLTGANKKKEDEHTFDALPCSRSPDTLWISQSLSETSRLGPEDETPSIIYSTPRMERSIQGYLGPTSFVAGLEDDGYLISDAGEQSSQDASEGLAISPIPWWRMRLAEVLRSLQSFSTIRHLIQEYYAVTQAAVIPSPVILNALAEIEITLCESLPAATDTIANTQFSTLSTSIVQNTRKSFKIPPYVTGALFHKSFTGSHLRLEIIGIICALAGRASYFGLSGSRTSNSKSQIRFSRKMLAACDFALNTCKNLTVLNDLTLWLVHENLLLSSLVLGDSSSITWQRLGELANDIFELGVHRDTASETPLPLLILESRRRLFAAAYQFDKSIATFLGRPPRISWRHSDCSLPLDIPDLALAGNAEILETAQTSLDANGWNTRKVYQRATWIRLRFIISTFREEILELSLQKPSEERTDQLTAVSRRCNQTWASLPEHLHYTPECWATDLPASVKMMLLISYMAYLYNEFLVQNLLSNDSEGMNPAQLDVSATILSTTLTLGRQWERSIASQRDFSWIILLYGFSAASVLIRELQKQAKTGQRMLYSGSQASLIRNLSVFISHMESMALPDQTSSSFFKRATIIFSRIVDEILEPPLRVSLADGDIDTTLAAELDAPFLLDLEELELLELLENKDFRASFDQVIC